MKVHLFRDSDVFYNESVRALKENSVENSLFLGLAQQTLRGNKPPLFMCSVEYDVFCLQTIPNQAVLAFKTKQLSGSVINVFVQALKDRPITRFVGVKEPTVRITQLLGKTRACSVQTVMNQRLYQLNLTSVSPISGGHIRKMKREDIPFVANWIQDFDYEANLSEQRITVKEAEKTARQQLDKGGLYLLEVDGIAVAMANATRKIGQSVTINLVYTPKPFRQNGFATRCVTVLCHQCIKDGFSVILLYTDLDNPTSNHIYQEIGFEPVSDSIVMEVKKVD
ncbi:GNAT family N-acetyltransferase [Shouchella miscanthi]|uniref:GNAT family N-acetyltransferase n=1 Tax=Shouchella miscanthi TaxID=2598861 RepID=A0ABU6NFR2_9BACI|nr:GNAT family N-acetyltransferase [Shouchella miscanthi]MED4126624.1 GNAT family N-acetyltransferase [Shouchella miscanthi]